jgi:recombination protein RecA
VREVINSMPFGPKLTTPGGRALKHACSLRFDIKRLKKLSEGEEASGHQVQVTVTKNKCAAPFRVARMDLIYGKGIDRYREVASLALELGLLEKSGSWVKHKGENVAQGLAATVEVLREDKRLFSELRAGVFAGLGLGVGRKESNEKT